MNLKIGTSGWSYKHWSEVFYPKNLKRNEYLEFYSKKFKTAEINSTFYRLPFVQFISSWNKRTGEDFHFSIKLTRRATHYKRLKVDDDLKEALDKFFGRLAPLKKKIDVILIQLPPSQRS